MSAFKILVTQNGPSPFPNEPLLRNEAHSRVDNQSSTKRLLSNSSLRCVRCYATIATDATEQLFYLNLRFVGVGFRGYIIKKMIPVGKLSDEKKKLASR
jgi:hypothetical protein